MAQPTRCGGADHHQLGCRLWPRRELHEPIGFGSRTQELDPRVPLEEVQDLLVEPEVVDADDDPGPAGTDRPEIRSARR